ncbi:unnamed protein product [marine sediment metagenome]|uniref:Uncharacterized protein n=1 Tax=marine sediment metagenome TaxID=412755 RepID=X1U864_9ZZZZ
MFNHFIFIQAWCSECSDITWHIVRIDAILDCLSCRAQGRQTSPGQPSQIPAGPPARNLICRGA